MGEQHLESVFPAIAGVEESSPGRGLEQGGDPFETGERLEDRDVWHGPMQSRDYYHWDEEILPVPGSDEPFCKYAVVAYAHEGTRLMQRRPQTRLARTWKALRRLLDGCKRRYDKWQSADKR